MVTDLELERAEQLLERLRLDSLNALLNQHCKNKQLREDVEALPGALKVVLGRLHLRMRTLTTLGERLAHAQEQLKQARAMALSLADAVDVDLDYEDRLFVDERMSRECGSAWRQEVRSWPEI